MIVSASSNELLVPPEIQAQAKACREAWPAIPSFQQWKQSHDMGHNLPPAPPLLKLWQANAADGSTWGHSHELRHAAPGHAIVVSSQANYLLPTNQAQAFERAAQAAGIAQRLLREDDKLSQYPWHRELDVIQDIEIKTLDPATIWLRPEPGLWPWQPLPKRPSRILYRLSLKSADGKESVIDLPTDMAWLWEDEHDLKGSLPLVAKGSPLGVDDLVRIFKRAYFDGTSESDAKELTGFAGESEFEDAALHLAVRILASDEEASQRTLARIAERSLPHVLQPDKILRIEVVDRIREEDPLVVVQDTASSKEADPAQQEIPSP